MSGKIEEQGWAEWMESGLRWMMENKPDAIVMVCLMDTPRQKGKSGFPEAVIGNWNCSTNDIGYMARRLENIYITRMLAEYKEQEETDDEHGVL